MTTLDERYQKGIETRTKFGGGTLTCLLYTSDAADE